MNIFRKDYNLVHVVTSSLFQINSLNFDLYRINVSRKWQKIVTSDLREITQFDCFCLDV